VGTVCRTSRWEMKNSNKNNKLILNKKKKSRERANACKSKKDQKTQSSLRQSKSSRKCARKGFLSKGSAASRSRDTKFVSFVRSGYANTTQFQSDFGPGKSRRAALAEIEEVLGSANNHGELRRAWMSLCKSPLPNWAEREISKFSRQKKWPSSPKIYLVKLDHNWRLVLCKLEHDSIKFVQHVFKSTHDKQDEYFRTALHLIAKRDLLTCRA